MTLNTNHTENYYSYNIQFYTMSSLPIWVRKLINKCILHYAEHYGLNAYSIIHSFYKPNDKYLLNDALELSRINAHTTYESQNPEYTYKILISKEDAISYILKYQ